MTDSMKFGPEWLRNMSNDVGNSSSSTSNSGGVSVPFGMSFNNNSNSSNNTNNCGSSLSAATAAPRYQLAEFRYGREEMLSLYDKNVKLPELLPKFKKLFIEKIQCPLALLPPSTDDEVRLWQMRGSTAIGGLGSERGTGALGLGSGSLNMSSLGTGSSLSGISGRGTRGSSIDRGRGRIRGGLYNSSLGNYQRAGFLYDEETRGLGGRSDRQWSERNGGGLSDTLDWNGSSSTTSPRKEYLTRSNNVGESWRRSRLEDDTSNLNGTTDGWRSSGGGSSNMYKWPTRSTSWRGESDITSASPTNAPGSLQSDVSPIGNTTPHRLERSMSHTTPTNRDNDSINSNLRRSVINPSWDDDNLPEWAMDEPMEGGGSFDATGAFHGAEEGDINGVKRNTVDASSADSVQKDSNRNTPYKIPTKPSHDQNDDHFDTDSANDVTETQRSKAKADIKKNVQNNIEHLKSSASKDESKIAENISNFVKDRTDEGNSVQDPEQVNNNRTESSMENELHTSTATQHFNPTLSEPSGVDRMKEVASDIEKLIMDDDLLGSDHDTALISASKKHLEGPNNMNNNAKVAGSTPTSFLNLIPNSDNCGLVGLQSFSPSQQQPPQVLQHVPPAGANAPELWFYRDPQGKVQGPFTATEMAEWYRAGYFDDSLFVRRVCDSRFSALGDLLKLCGGAIPFLSSHLIPPLIQNIGGDLNMGITAGGPSGNKPPIQLSHQSPSVQPGLPGLDGPQQDNIRAAALKYHIHNVQSQYMLRQQSIIIQKLSESDHWGLLNSEQQAALIAQRMAQVQIPDSLLSHAAGNANNNLNPQQQQSILMHQMMTGTNQIPHQKSPVPNKPTLMKQQQSIPHLYNHHPHHEFNPNASNNNGPNESVQQLLHTMSLNQIQIPPPVPMPSSAGAIPHPNAGSHQPAPPQMMVENDPIKSLIYQLSMQKRSSPNIVQQQQQQQISLASNEKWIPSGPSIHHDPSVVAVQHQTNQQSSQIVGQWNSSNTPLSMWDIPIPPNIGNTANSGPPISNLHSNLVPKSSMKTEMQILEEHLQLKMKEDHMKKEIEFLAAQQQQKNQWNTQKNITQSMIKQFPNQQPTAQIQLAPQIHQQQQQQQQQHQQQMVQQAQQPSQPQQQLQQSLQQQQPVLQIPQRLVDETKKLPSEKSKIILQEEGQGMIEQNIDANQTTSTKQLLKNAKKIKTDSASASSNKGSNDDGKGKKILKPDGSVFNDTDNALSANNIIVSNNNNNNKNSIAVNSSTKQNVKEGGKKKNKDKDSKVAEEKKRQQEEAERQYLEEKKRLEDIAEQRKSKLMEQNNRIEDQSQSSGQKRNNLAASIAPWSSFTTGNATSSGSLSLAEIQRAERERRAEQFRIEQAIREQQQSHAMLEQQQQKDSILKWNLKPQNHIKSLAEIQAEESKARQAIEQQQLTQSQQNQKKDTDKFASLWNNASPLQWSNAKMWAEAAATNSTSANSSTSASGFWEEPSKPSSLMKSNSTLGTTAAVKTLSKSQTVSNMQTQAATSKPIGNVSGSASSANNKSTPSKGNASSSAATNTTNNNSLPKKSKASSSKKVNANNDNNGNNEFTAWCSKALSAHVDVIDVPTFISFLRDIESPYEVKDYIRMYLGENKECSEFAKQFLERRSKYKNMQRAANAHIDDMCSPAPAITPANENQESKNKGKKEKKKSKMTKLDSRILGFSITSAEDRLNVGDRDYARE